MSKRTLLVNLFGGPHAGKSTVAHGLSHALKTLGITIEYIPEAAKEFMYSGVEANQVLITAMQYERILNKDGKATVMVVDSPLMLGPVYPSPRGCSPAWRNAVYAQHCEFTSINFFILRDATRPYDTVGRREDFPTALAKDHEIRRLLDQYSIPYQDVWMSEHAHVGILPAILARIAEVSGG